ncbi:MAG: PilZ domain-containing protein [Myxococcota bacterium]
MANSRAVLLVDDGELDDIQQILESLGIDFERFRGGAVPSDLAPPTDLLVSTPRCIDAIRIFADDFAADPPTRIVVVNEDSGSLRAELREIGFDYLARRPVHPEALRLLVAHCVYRGEERRAEPRVPVGFEISFRSGVLSRRATLADLSTRGCRLLSPYPLDAGKRVCVTLPEAVGATEALVIEGTILRNHFDEQLGLDGLYAAAVQFEDISPEIRNELVWILEDKVSGPPTLPSDARVRDAHSGVAANRAHPGATRRLASEPGRHRRRAFRETVAASCPPDPRSEDSCVAATGLPNEGTSTEDLFSAQLTIDVDVRMAAQHADTIADRVSIERRSTGRRPYGAKVPAFGTRVLRILIGRDLSPGGMRIEYNPSLELGDRLHLAIYGLPSDDPLIVWGTLTRDDCELGMGIEFDDVHPIVTEQLEKTIGSLPSVESLRDDASAATRTVLTEILDR